MPSVALQLEDVEATAAVAVDYPRRRRLLELGVLRRGRALPSPNGRVVVATGDAVDSGTPVARYVYTGRATAVDLGAALGLSGEVGDQVSRSMVRKVGDLVAEGELIAERSALGGLRRYPVRSPVTGRVTHLSSTTGVALVSPAPVEVDVAAHLAGTVRATSEDGVVVEGPALAVAGRAGAGPAVTGPLVIAETVEALPEDVAGAVVACGFPLDASLARALVDGGAAAIVASTIEEAALEHLGWEDAFWPNRSLTGVVHEVAVPLTVVVVSFAPAAPPAAVWDALRPLNGRTVSALGAGAGAAPELLVPLSPNEVHGGAPEEEEHAAIVPGRRVRVVAGRSEGLVGEVVAVSSGPYRLRSELDAGLADVAFPYDVRLRLPVLHLQLVE